MHSGILMRRAGLACGAFCVLFVLLGCSLIPILGVQHDEALFAMTIWAPHYMAPVALGEYRFPAMLMTYLGGDKGYLYRAIFSLLEPNVWSLRLPVLFLGAATIALFFATLRRFVPDWAALGGAALLATDAMFLVTTTFDWGPLALQHLWTVAAVFLLTRTPPRVFPAFLCFGLALWDKAIALWVLAAIAAAAVSLFPRELRQAVTRRRIALAVTGLAIGGLPLWLYNLQNGFRTFRDNTSFSTELLFYKTHLLVECLNGPAVIGWMFRGPRPGFTSLTLLLLLVAVIAGRRHRAMWFGVLAGALIFVQMLLVKNAGTGPQHTMLVWPWVHWSIACGLAAVARTRPAVAAAAAGVIANVLMIGVYVRNGWTAGGAPTWSDAIVTAARGIRLEPGETVLAGDWSILYPLMLLSNGRLPIEGDTQDLRRHLVVSHPDGEEAMANINAQWDARAAAQGLDRQHVATWNDRQGRPTVIAFRYRARRVTSGQIPRAH
jgi:hypothetical protein